MTNLGKRLLNFFFFTPPLIAIIFFLPHKNHLLLILLITIAGILAGQEMRRMLSRVASLAPFWFVLFPALFPLSAWLVGMGWVRASLGNILLLTGIFLALLDALRIRKKEWENGITRIGTRLLLVFYPGWFLWWLAQLSTLDNAQTIITLFFATVWSNDIFAWFFGMTFGRRSQKILAVSPKKSLVGFLSGGLGSITVLLVLSQLFSLPHPWWMIFLLGLISAFTTIAGDLIESALKRSVAIKDSGTLMIGRGGVLDSMDSHLFTAPIFLLFFTGLAL